MILEEYSFKKEIKDSKISIELPLEWIGRTVEIVVKPISILKTKAISDELSSLITGLYWVSESDEPFEIIVDHRLPVNMKLEKWLIKKFDLKQPIEATTIDFFFKNAIFHQNWHDEQEKETVKKYQKIYQLSTFNYRYRQAICFDRQGIYPSFSITTSMASLILIILSIASLSISMSKVSSISRVISTKRAELIFRSCKIFESSVAVSHTSGLRVYFFNMV